MTDGFDTERILERHRAFWECEVVDRVCLAVYAPAEVNTPAPQARDDEQLLADPEFGVQRALYGLANTVHIGDALPMAYAEGNLLYPVWGGLGRFDSHTVWVDSVYKDWRDWKTYRFDPDNIWVRRFLDVNRALAKQARGRYLISTQGFFGATDAMALIRGYGDFMIELAMDEAAEVIRAAQQEAVRGHIDLVKRCWDIVEGSQKGTAMDPGIWAPGRINYWSADFSCMIGPRDFARWVMPEMAQMAEAFEYPFYHLDGPGAARHLPAIAELRKLRGIQYTPGPGEGIDRIIEMARRIQVTGKCTWVRVDASHVERVVSQLDPRGLFVFTHASSVEEGKYLLKRAARWSSRRPG